MFPKKYIFIIIFIFAVLLCGKEAHAATEFVSTIRATGGDYSLLSTWEAAVQSDLTASTTVVYSGTGTGSITAASVLELFRGGVYQDITASTTATTTTQILVNSFSGAYKVLQDGDQWRVASSTANMWTVSIAGLGDSAIAVAKIDGAWTSAEVVPAGIIITGWTTSATNYIKIYTTAAARHNGKWSNTAYRLTQTTTSSYSLITILEENTRIEGLQFYRRYDYASTLNGIYVSSGLSTGKIYFGYNIVTSETPSSGGIRGIYIEDSDPTSYIYNNIFYNFTGTGKGIAAGASTPKAYIYNNTVQNCTTGIITTNTGVVVKNNIVQDCANGYNGTFNAASNYNISDLADDAPGANSKNSTNVAFVDEANDDFHLAGNDSAARNAGTDLSADANLPFSDDIDGDARGYRGAWDIGADETFSATQINSPQTNVLNDDSLVGYWSFNGQDMGTTSATDLSGNSNTGWLMNGVKKVPGVSGQGLSFDGVDDYVEVGNNNNLKSAQTTFCGWVKVGVQSTYGSIYCGKGANDYIRGMCLLVTNSGINFYSKTTGYSLDYWTNAFSPSVGQWTHICAVTNGVNKLAYTNGILTGTNNIDDGDLDWTGSSNMSFGFTTADGASRYFNGQIDEARVYNRALSADEIGQLYRAGARKMKIDPTKGYKTIIK